MLTKKHLVPNTLYNNQYKHTFPSVTDYPEGTRISIEALNLYNIQAIRNNNNFSMYWSPNATTYDFIIEDGFYTISDINDLIKYYCDLNLLYTLNIKNERKYYFDLLINGVNYNTELRCYKIPTLAESIILEITIPVNETTLLPTWAFDTDNYVSQILVNTVEFGKLIGFNIGNYPVNITETETVITRSHFVPQTLIVSGLTLTCSAIIEENSNVNDLIWFDAINNDYGSLMKYKAYKDESKLMTLRKIKTITITIRDSENENFKINDVDGIVINIGIIIPPEKIL